MYLGIEGRSSWEWEASVGDTSETRGAREQAVQIRRCLCRSRIGAGGLIVQFCVVDISLDSVQLLAFCCF